MKKLFFLLILMGCLFPLHAQKGSAPTGIQQKIEAQIAAHRPSPAREKASSQPSREACIEQELRRAIQAPIHKQSLLSWQEFKQKNTALQQSLQQKYQKEYDKQCALFDTDCDAFHELSSEFSGKGRPDYAQETHSVKYIYASDASDHDTYSIPAEVARVMRAVRQVNPHARILFASEFFARTDPNEIPFRRAGSAENPFQKELSSFYNHLLRITDKLSIDTLGLDDLIFDAKRDAIKIGDMWVDTNTVPHNLLVSFASSVYGFDAEEFRRDLDFFRQNQDLYLEYRYILDSSSKESREQVWNSSDFKLFMEYMAGIEEARQDIILLLLSMSNWGMEQRNNQWAKRIEALAPFYDFIIVYGGNGHLLPFHTESVIEKIGKPGVLFNFFTEEKLSQQCQNYYERIDRFTEEEEPLAKKILPARRKDVEEYIDAHSYSSAKRWKAAPWKEDSHADISYEVIVDNTLKLTMFDILLPNSKPTPQP